MAPATTPTPPQSPDGAAAPPDAHVANRRRGFRVTAGGLSLKAWRMDPHERLIDRPLPSRRIIMTTVDLGRYGAGVVMPTPAPSSATVARPTVMPGPGDRWRLELPLDEDGETVMLEARVVSVVTLDESQIRIGLAFREQLSETQVRRINAALDKLLATLQRAELRRLRDSAA